MKILICFALMVAGCLAMPTDSDETDEQRVVGGQPAQNGQFPHMVSLRNNNRHFCGGSILNANTVLTAAHCVHGKSPTGMTVVAGTNTLNVGGTAIPVARIITHASYNSDKLLNDIAVIKLSSSFQMTSVIQSIPLRTTSLASQETLRLSGWGLTSYPGSVANNLQWINLKSLDWQSCSSRLQGYSPITAGHVCTSSPVNQGSCQGDSGGPLIDTTGKQVGIVSWGIPCAKGRPDVFTSVLYYNVWIRQNL